MKFKVVIALVALSMVAAACGEEAQQSGGGLVLDNPDQVFDIQPAVFSYGFGDIDTLTYDTSITGDISFDADYGPDASFKDSGTIFMEAVIIYSVADGPDPDTYEITVDTEMESFGMAGFETMSAGQEVSAEDLGIGLDAFIPEITMVVDAQGNALSAAADGVAIPTDFMGGDFSGLTGNAGTQLFGPAFPEDQLTVGSTWTDEETTDIPGFGPWTITTDNEVVATDVVDGRETIVIQSTAKAPALVMNLADMMAGLEEMEPLLGDEFSGAEFDDLMTSMMQGMEMDIRMELVTMKTTSWFDFNDGIVVRTQADMGMIMVMNMTMFGESGRMDMSMKMEIKQDLR